MRPSVGCRLVPLRETHTPTDTRASVSLPLSITALTHTHISCVTPPPAPARSRPAARAQHRPRGRLPRRRAAVDARPLSAGAGEEDQAAAHGAELVRPRRHCGVCRLTRRHCVCTPCFLVATALLTARTVCVCFPRHCVCTPCFLCASLPLTRRTVCARRLVALFSKSCVVASLSVCRFTRCCRHCVCTYRFLVPLTGRTVCVALFSNSCVVASLECVPDHPPPPPLCMHVPLPGACN